MSWERESGPSLADGKNPPTCLTDRHSAEAKEHPKLYKRQQVQQPEEQQHPGGWEQNCGHFTLLYYIMSYIISYHIISVYIIYIVLHTQVAHDSFNILTLFKMNTDQSFLL